MTEKELDNSNILEELDENLKKHRYLLKVQAEITQSIRWNKSYKID